ncbi:response regulator transcription factor [Robiginitalea marina]|nr:response regulator transcription factor [Robiginitalea marina]
MTMQNTITLNTIIIDPDARLHEAYAYYFSTYPEYTLKGIYRSVEEALSDYAAVRPEIILCEARFPKTPGLEQIGEFRKQNPEVKIIMVSGENDFEVIKKAFKNGASGYLTKPITKKRLKDALNSIRYEGAALSNDIARKIIQAFRRKSYDCFSDRENEIIECLSQGDTYKTIAEKLYVSPSTINFHIQNIYLKLDVNSKSEALQKLRTLDYA